MNSSVLAVSAAALVVGLTVGCTDDGNDLLQLNGGSVSPEDYRIYLREVFDTDDPWRQVCIDQRPLSPTEILATEGYEMTNKNLDFPGWQPRPGQQANEDDLLAVVGIFKEECERFIE